MWKLARNDPKCCAVGKRYDEMEDTFSKCVAGLSREDQDIVWGFVTTSHELDFCVMELMCELFDIDPAAYLEKMESNPHGAGAPKASLCKGSCQRS